MLRISVLSLEIHPLSGSIFSRILRVRMGLVTVPRRNPETSYCEVRKSVQNSFGVYRPIEVVAVVIGVVRAQVAVEHFTQHLTELEEHAGVSLDWEYRSRQSRRV
jgi:hypothetical protein